MVTVLPEGEYEQLAPAGRFRHVTVTLVAEEERTTGYVADEPGDTEAVTVVKVGGVPEPESTSNCIELEVPPPGGGVCTVTAVVPPEAMSEAGTCAVSWVALPYCVESAVLPQ